MNKNSEIAVFASGLYKTCYISKVYNTHTKHMLMLLLVFLKIYLSLLWVIGLLFLKTCPGAHNIFLLLPSCSYAWNSSLCMWIVFQANMFMLKSKLRLVGSLECSYEYMGFITGKVSDNNTGFKIRSKGSILILCNQCCATSPPYFYSLFREEEEKLFQKGNK